jgi:hypothetical protein
MKRLPRRRACLLGIGLDGDDGHRRITRAEKFSVVGGSEETHARMTETLIKTVEALRRNGTTLEEIPPGKLAALLRENRPD